MQTLAEIEAATNAAKLQRALFVKPQLEAVRDLLASEHAAALRTGLAAVELPAGEDKNQVGNIINVLSVLAPYFANRINDVAAEIAALSPPPPEDEEVPDSPADGGE